jgi:hypothetical protein
MCAFSVRVIFKLFFRIRIKNQHVLDKSVLCDCFAMALAAKLVFLKCIKPKSIGSKILILHYQLTAVGLASNMDSVCVHQNQRPL